jgi:hypothetical protein
MAKVSLQAERGESRRPGAGRPLDAPPANQLMILWLPIT